MNTYEEYKDSGVEWIGEIPAHWEVKKLKYLVSLNRRDDGNETFKIALENLESWSGRLLSTTTELQFDGVGNFFEKGDVLCSKLRPYLAKAHIAELSGVAVGELLVFTPNAEVLQSGYLLYRILTPAFIDLVNSSTYGAKMPRANWDFIGNIQLALPSSLEQSAISRYLDHKTAEIDALINAKQTLLQKLGAQRAAIINDAVTKGLNTSAPMKTSGIKWLGEVPTHWAIKKLKFIVDGNLKYGANEAAEMDDTHLPRYIRITDFGSDGSLKDETFKSLPEDIAVDYLLSEGDILFARSGATVGKTFQFKNFSGKACFAGYLIKASPNTQIISSDFLYYFTKSNVYENWRASSFILATIQNISADKYKNLEFPVPPLEEQSLITKYLDYRTAQLDSARQKLQTQISKLRSYRQSLITEVVTGKRRVTEQVSEPA